jgi:predicted nucleotidyltransferase
LSIGLKDAINKNRDLFEQICHRHSVSKLYAFGSSLTDRFNEATSDIDLLVSVDLADPVERGETLISLWEALEHFFNRKVDLLTESSLKNPHLKSSIDKGKILIYDGKTEEVFI